MNINKKLIDDIFNMVAFAHNHSDKLMDRFFWEAKEEGFELNQFYISGSTCLAILGQTNRWIKTSEFIDWVEEQNNIAKGDAE